MTDWPMRSVLRRGTPLIPVDRVVVIDALHDLVGLPSDTHARVIARAAEAQSESLFIEAATGNRLAQKELAELEFAYRVWVYARR